MEEGLLFSGSIVVDNIITTTWMVITIAIPRALIHVWPRAKGREIESIIGDVSTGEKEDTETLQPVDLGKVLGLGFGAVWLSEQIASLVPAVPSAIILTVIALILAQIPTLSKLPGLRVMGMFAVYLFLAVIGAYCDIGAMGELGELGVNLLIFTSITVLVHGMLVYSAAFLFKIDPVVASIAGQHRRGHFRARARPKSGA